MQARLLRLIWTLVLWGAMSLGGAAHAQSIRFVEAQFVLDEAQTPPSQTANWKTQALPDGWRRNRPGVSGHGWYRFKVRLDAAPADTWAVLAFRGGEHVTAFVNGRVIGRTGMPEEGSRLTWKRPVLFSVPPALLIAGDNTLDLRVRGEADRPSGLSPVVVGSEDELGRAYRTRITYQAFAPAAIAISVGLLGAFFLVLWAKRRREPVYLLFGVSSLMWAVRTVWDIHFHNALPPFHWEILRTTLYAGFVCCMCLFALRFADTRLPRFEVLAMGMIPGTPLLMLIASPFVAPVDSSQVVLFVMILITVRATLEVLRVARITPDPGVRMMAAAGVASFGFGVHDWVAAQSAELFDHIRLVPYVVLAYMLVMSWLVTRRFAATFSELEEMNVELDRRVAAKSVELMANMRELEAAKASAEAANAAKSRFLAAASHDLRQPLYALGLFTTALVMRARTPEISNIAGKIERSVEALEKMFNELLDISRLDSGAMEPSFEAVRVQDIFDRLAADFAPVAEGKGVRFCVHRADFWVRTDPVMLERALGNLVGNAVRYTDRGGVLLAPRQHDGRLWIQVWDTGIGIAEGDGPRIFDEFYQAANPGRDRSKGLGLGLSIVRRLAGALGEEVRWRSIPGRGSRFELSVTPTHPPVREDAGVPPPLPDVPGGHRVVVVEDDQIVREAVTDLLEQWGIHAIGGPDEDTVVAQLEGSRPPDLIIADVRLAGPDSGVAVARSLRRRFGSAIPVLLVTGETSREHLAEVLGSGWPVLQKPISGARLYQQVQLMLAARSS